MLYKNEAYFKAQQNNSSIENKIINVCKIVKLILLLKHNYSMLLKFLTKIFLMSHNLNINSKNT